MWLISVAVACVVLAHGGYLVSLLLRPARVEAVEPGQPSTGRRIALLTIGLLLVAAQVAAAIFAAVADHAETTYQVAWLIVLPGVIAVAAVVQLLATLALPRAQRGPGMKVALGILAFIAFGIGACYATLLG